MKIEFNRNKKSGTNIKHYFMFKRNLLRQKAQHLRYSTYREMKKKQKEIVKSRGGNPIRREETTTNKEIQRRIGIELENNFYRMDTFEWTMTYYPNNKNWGLLER